MLQVLNRGWSLNRRESVGGVWERSPYRRGRKPTSSAGNDGFPQNCISNWLTEPGRSIPTANPCAPCIFASLLRRYSSSSSICSWHPITGDAPNPNEPVKCDSNNAECEGRRRVNLAAFWHGQWCSGRCIVLLSVFCCLGGQCHIFGGNMIISIYRLLCGILQLRQ